MIGQTLLKIGRVLFDERLYSTAVEPTIADLRRELADAGSTRARVQARWRGYAAFWKLVLLAPFIDRSSLSPRSAVAAVVLVFALVEPGVSMLGIWLLAVTAGAVLCATALHAWYNSHPSDVPGPSEPRKATPQINFSSTEVAGNIGGLIFAIGSLFIVVVGVPAVIWFLFAGTAAGCVIAWGLVQRHIKRPRSGLPENLIVLR